MVLVPGPVRARSGRRQGLRHLRTPPRLRAGWHTPHPRPSQRAPGPLPGPLRSFPDLQSATPSLLVTCRWPQKPPPCGGTANHLQSCPHTRAQLVCRSRTAFAVAIHSGLGRFRRRGRRISMPTVGTSDDERHSLRFADLDFLWTVATRVRPEPAPAARVSPRGAVRGPRRNGPCFSPPSASPRSGPRRFGSRSAPFPQG